MYYPEVIVKTLEYLPINDIARFLTVNKLWHYSALHAHLWNREFSLPQQMKRLRYPVQNFVNPLDFRPKLIVTSKTPWIDEETLNFIRTFPNGVKKLTVHGKTTETVLNLLLSLSQCNLRLELLRYDPSIHCLSDPLNRTYIKRLLIKNKDTLREVLTDTNLYFIEEETYPKLHTISCHKLNVNGNQLPALKIISCMGLSVENGAAILPNLACLMIHGISRSKDIPSCSIPNIRSLSIRPDHVQNININELTQLKVLQMGTKLDPAPICVKSPSLEEIVIRDRGCRGILDTIDLRSCFKIKRLTCSLKILINKPEILLPQNTVLDTLTVVIGRYKNPVPEDLESYLKPCTHKVLFLSNYYERSR
jgi:hypothetical protein